MLLYSFLSGRRVTEWLFANQSPFDDDLAGKHRNCMVSLTFHLRPLGHHPQISAEMELDGQLFWKQFPANETREMKMHCQEQHSETMNVTTTSSSKLGSTTAENEEETMELQSIPFVFLCSNH